MTTVTTNDRAPSRRERLRTATLAEIKQLARQRMASGGPSAVSLRAIARDLGMTAPAIYRYFPSLDALVGAVCTDVCAELDEAFTAARDRFPADAPAERIAAMARTFRGWALAHPAEFSLVFGNVPAPDPGDGTAPPPSPQRGGDPYAASARCGEAFLAELVVLWQQHGFAPPAPEPAAGTVSGCLAPEFAADVAGFPPEVVAAFLSGWIRMYGLVAMEVFGHLSWAVTDPEPLFEAEVAAFLHQLTG